MDINSITYDIIGCAFRVHRELGPGLYESSYRVCLMHELMEKGLAVVKEKPLPVSYRGITLDAGYRVDLIVEERVIVELKAVQALHPNHSAQILTYMKLSCIRTGLLFNFHEANLRNGLVRFRL